ncbi:MAG: UxaA family hydrolase [Clostridia bacterium]
MRIHPLDNVEVNLENGHKYALRPIEDGEMILKYGDPIGHAIRDIAKGEHVHSHNMRTNLSGNLEYRYQPNYVETERGPYQPDLFRLCARRWRGRDPQR